MLFYTLTKIHKQTINKDKYSIYNCAERFGYIECADDFMQYNDIRNYVSHPFKHYTELSDPHTFMLSKIENNINDNMDVFTKRWVLSAQKAGADYAHIVHDPYLEIATNQQYDIDCLLHFVLFYTDYLNTKVEKLGLKKNIELMAKLAEYNIISEKTVKNIMDFRHTRNKTAHGDIIICNNTVNIQEIWTTIVQCTMMVELIETNLHLYQSTTNDHSHDYS